MPPPALGMIVRRRFGALVWTRSFSNSSLGALLERLSGHMGSESAKLELKWMREELRTRRTAATSATSSPSPKKDESGWELGELRKMVDRRLQGEPLQYILGNQPFGPIAIKTRAPTLIPRPETEDWTIRLASFLENRFPTKAGGERTILRMLDLCTGTGCIPILLSHLRRQAGGITVAYGADISTDAVSLARENATDQSLTPSSGPDWIVSHDGGPEARSEVVETGELGGRANHARGIANLNAASAADGGRGSTLEVIRADILQEDFVQVVLSRTEAPFDVITSNPPYIPLDEYERLPNSVKEWEDRRALLGDLPTHESGDGSKGRGLMFYYRIAQIVSADGVLASNGVVALEVGHTQAEQVREILRETGRMTATEVWKDPWGIPRVVVGYR